LQRLAELENRRTSIQVTGDVLALSTLLSDRLIYGHSGGTVDTKESLLALMRSGTLRYVSIEARIDRANWQGEDGIIGSGRLTTEAIIAGQTRHLDGRYMCAWRRRGGAWQLEALQGTDAWPPDRAT